MGLPTAGRSRVRDAARSLSVVLSAALTLSPSAALAGELEPGSTLSVRLTSRISSHDSRAGDPVEAVLIAPARDAEGPVLPAGTVVKGHVIEVRHGLGRRASVRLRFDELVALDGARFDIDARVSDVDNAREEVTSDGTIVGLPPFSSKPSAAHIALLIAALPHPVLLALVEAGRFAGRRAQHGVIDYAPGVEMHLALERSAKLPDAPAVVPVSFRAVSLEQDLAGVVGGLPLRTVAPKHERESDLTNLLLVGSQQEIEAAFAAAGWTRAKAMHAGTVAKGLLALASRHAYRPAPVSAQELSGRAPDLVFEKQCNTLTKRHHVRLWSGFVGPGGAPAWVGAASHDVGILYSRPERTLTHRVDPHIDLERSKVVDDLLFTGRVETAALVERPQAPRSFTTAAGTSVESDGRMAVLFLGRPARGGATIASAAP